jgi:hypothetical protein
MLLSALLFGLTLQAAPALSVQCGNNLDAQTTPLRSPAGFTVALVLHTEDDHSKNSHLCMASVSLNVTLPGLKATTPDGSTGQFGNLANDDDAWNRLITLRVDGFSPDGNLAYVFISDGGYVDVIEYDLRTGRQRAAYLRPVAAWGMPAACADLLHVLGTSRSNRLVLATTAGGGCAKQELWEAPNQKQNGAILPERPIRIASEAGVTHLVPGQLVEH